jgi:hypothetical protein
MRYNAQGETRSYLESVLGDDVVVRTKVPNPRPEKFVLVRQEAGRRVNKHMSRDGIGLFTWAPTEAEAHDIAQLASDAMFEMMHLNGVADVTEEMLLSSQDPEDGSPRWYGSYTLTTYEI